MDPATGYDAIANVGLIGNRIALITTDDINGKTIIDASNLVVAPGFIDVLSYEPNSYGVWYKLGDGVTTNLGMHGIKTPVDAKGFFSNYTGKNAPPINFGGAFSDQWYRDSIGVKSVATPAQLSRLSDALNKQLDAGWIGLSIDPEYAPSINFNEYAALAQVAKQAEMPLFTHIRYSSPGPAGKSSLDAIDEVLNVARQTGVSLHVDHIPSMATHVMPEAIAKIDAARSEGLDITGCFYPYTFWGTYLGSARFAGDWQSRFRISYNDLQLAGSSERLTPESFKKYQAQNKLVADVQGHFLCARCRSHRQRPQRREARKPRRPSHHWSTRLAERATTRSLIIHLDSRHLLFTSRSSCYGSWAIVQRRSILPHDRAQFCPSMIGAQPW